MEQAQNALNSIFGSSRVRRSSAHSDDDTFRHDSITGSKDGVVYGSSSANRYSDSHSHSHSHSHDHDHANATADTTITQQVEKAAIHEKLNYQHEDRDQTRIDRECVMKHYHTTVQLLNDSETKEVKHSQKTGTSKALVFDHDDGKAEASRPSFQNSTEESRTHIQGPKETINGTTIVHHHVHETVIPVIKRDIYIPSVTTNIHHILEKHNEVAVDHGVTTNDAIPISEFKYKLVGEKPKHFKTFPGAPDFSSSKSSSSSFHTREH